MASDIGAHRGQWADGLPPGERIGRRKSQHVRTCVYMYACRAPHDQFIACKQQLHQPLHTHNNVLSAALFRRGRKLGARTRSPPLALKRVSRVASGGTAECGREVAADIGCRSADQRVGQPHDAPSCMYPRAHRATRACGRDRSGVASRYRSVGRSTSC